MIMDGLDTLSQVALADQLNLSFDTYNTGPLQGDNGGNLIHQEADTLNTPCTTSSDVNFNFHSAELEICQQALPITGEFAYIFL